MYALVKSNLKRKKPLIKLKQNNINNNNNNKYYCKPIDLHAYHLPSDITHQMEFVWYTYKY